MTTARSATTAAANGPLLKAAAGLYVGEVMHARLKPVGHRFAYRVTNLVVDVDRLQEAGRSCRLFSVGRFNLFSFHERDHGERDGSPLRPHVDGLLSDAGVARPARVLLLCYPRVLGFVFDPISIYYALDGEDRVTALVYEVHNTFGESHSYVAPVRPGEATDAGIRQSCPKRFYVSPFMAMDQRYHFSLMPPGDQVRLRILETDAGGPTLAATFSGRYKPLRDRTLAAIFAAMPLHTLKVVAAINFEAARLWLKGAPFHAHRRKTGASHSVEHRRADAAE
jgi:DUF1365 family protein